MQCQAIAFNRVRQRGAVLFVSLMLLLILTLIGVTAARMQTVEERMAQNDDNHQLAVQAAEAALRYGETLLLGGIYSTPDFAANANGLYQLRAEVQAAVGSSNPTQGSIVDSINWSSPGTQTMAYAGPGLSDAPAPPQSAQIVIESLPPVARAGDPICTSGYGQEQVCSVYRITAHAVGGDSTSAATLQSIFH
jgi:type IV pilus assembly protein PilX